MKKISSRGRPPTNPTTIAKQKQERKERQEKIDELKQNLGEELIAKTKTQRKEQKKAEEKADSIYDYRMLSHFQHRLRQSKQKVRDIKSQKAGKEIQRLKKQNKDVTEIEPDYKFGY